MIVITENWHCPQCNAAIIKEECDSARVVLASRSECEIRCDSCYEKLMADTSMSKDGFLEINEMWVYD
jgi:hypothetical protein